MTIEALLLDLDRTLVDVQTYTDYEEACRHLEQELGAVELIDVPESGWRSATHQAMATLSSLAPDPPAWARADEIISRFEADAVENQAVAMPYLADFLASTASLPRAIVTLMGQEPAIACCSRFGIEVDTVVGRSRGLLPKPEPDQLERGLELLGAPRGTSLMIGDSPWDQVAARAAGVAFLGLSNGGASVFHSGVDVVDDLRAVAATLSR